MSNWVNTNYPIGKEIEAPHPHTGEWERADVVNFTTSTDIAHRGHTTGVIVRHPDNAFQEIEAGLLDEEGEGLR